MEPILRATGLKAGYNGHPFIRDLNLHVEAGEVVALLGANGAGKTTTILTLCGELRPIGGTLEVEGKPTTLPLHRRCSTGLSLVTEERSVLMGLTVMENLRLGGSDVERAFELFPSIKPLAQRQCGLLSGGEQQMVTLARALSRKTRLLVADELSLGLAPLIVQRLLQAVRHAADEDGIGALLVEQHVRQVLKVADRAYVLRRGELVLSGTAEEVGARISDLEDSYLGAASPTSPLPVG